MRRVYGIIFIKINKMKEILRYLSVIFYHRFVVIKTIKEAEVRGLKFEHNVYGDSINRYNCRSFWYDEYDMRYRCAELKNNT